MRGDLTQLYPGSIASSKFIVPILCVLAACVFLEQHFLRESFWLDECISAWVISDGVKEVTSRAVQFQGQSPLYYLLLWSVQDTLGASEFNLRVFSLLLLTLSVPVFFKIVELLFNRETALYSSIFFMLHPALLRALSARPYALALLFALLATLSLILWRQCGQKKWLCGYALLLAATWYAHFLFSFIVLVHVLWVLVTRSKGELPRMAMALGVSAVLVLPGLNQLLSLIMRRHDLSFVPFPGAARILDLLLPLSLVIPVGGGLLLAKILCRDMSFLKSGLAKSLSVATLCWLSGPLLFFILTLSGQASLFHDRYFLWSVGGLAVLFGLLLQSIHPEKARLRAFLLTLFLLIVAESERRWQIEDWRGAASLVNASPRAPVLLSSGLIESSHVEWLRSAEYRDYLQAPLRTYPVDNTITLLPQAATTDAQKRYVEERVIPVVREASKFYVVYLAPLSTEVAQLIRNAAAAAGCRSEVALSGPVTVQQFECGA